MKRKAMVLAASGLVSGAADAQSGITLYGLLDVGVEYVSNAGPDGKSTVGLISGGKNISRWGLRGAESLGNGLTAIFRLESGFDADTGQFYGNRPLFNRRAWVGMQHETLGSLRMGADYSTTFDFMAPFDPMDYAQNYSWAMSSTGSGNRQDSMFVRSSNVVRYDGQFGPVKVGGTLGFGEEPGSFRSSLKYDVAAGYSAGGFAAVVAWDRVHGAAGDPTDYVQGIHAGANYDFGALTLYAGYRNYRKIFATTAPKQLSDMYWVGAAYDFTPAFALYGAVYKQNIKGDTNADPVMVSLRAQYSFSKRTLAYVSAAYARARNGQAVSVSRDVAGFGGNQVGVLAGLQHRF
ncbi:MULTISPECIES: porin [unclassified Cupriavidus]|uniref:porin n=1 Tax=unclassified Cupriavidus TaxID=2640874 RepID=UPI001C004DCF|nr:MULTISPECIES: porin [unclassified Cupriavidus]MCA3186741.1 porin [Cupriavidus sp.]MCA3189623.1 porin [Cupriavidus sp.]MCA3195739.1 porin [Cupriavidus sp.]MCA3203897.1 porin [Cupriavidus sp.]MCA3206143.1 porin [Cupriavidus sp.]